LDLVRSLAINWLVVQFPFRSVFLHLGLAIPDDAIPARIAAT